MSAKPLAGLTIVFTGRMRRGRPDMEAEAARLGAYAEPRVTDRTDWLVMGTRPGKTKVNAADRKNTKKLTEEEFWKEIQNRLADAKAQVAAEAPEPIERAPAPEWATTVKTPRTIGF